MNPTMTNLLMIGHVLAKLPGLAATTEKHAAQIGNPDFQELVGYLSALPREQMLALIPIMYFGRDDCTSIVSMQEHCHVTFPDSRAMAHQMLEKSPALPVILRLQDAGHNWARLTWTVCPRPLST